MRDWNLSFGEGILSGWFVSITNNPYEGLKLWGGSRRCAFKKVSITNNPYEGLKLIIFQIEESWDNVSITNNPYEGLKQK